MGTGENRTRWQKLAVIWLALGASTLRGDWLGWPVFPEERALVVRDPEALPAAALPHTPPPLTLRDLSPQIPARQLSLDEAIRTALANTEAVRVLAGVASTASAGTIYDTAIRSTTIDEARARFDPTVQIQNGWNRLENPAAVFADPQFNTARIDGLRSDDFRHGGSLSQLNPWGGTASLNWDAGPRYLQPGRFPLNPQSQSSVSVQLEQPLLQGAGRVANLAPIVIARIDTERSYFQFKDGMQELVRGVIEAYWAVVFARTDVWAREQQVQQAQFAYERTEAAAEVGSANLGTVAQTKTALASFRASLLASRANLLQREASLRNLLGFPAYDSEQIVPVTVPLDQELDLDWDSVLSLAEVNRPDIIELKLVLEADEQLLARANNTALPRVDAVALYRWNGLEGEMPIGTNLASSAGQFTDWTLGVNFSVPLGLRQSRAALRRQELVISRDRANLTQGLHNASHQLALTVRNLAQYYDQYRAYTELREAAETNLNLQINEFRLGRQNFLVVLQAITDWGNAVSLQAQTLLQYNSELANLERRTGTILETHGVRFYEERMASISPFGRLLPPACYPHSLPPELNDDRYQTGEKPSEEYFDLANPIHRIAPGAVP